MSWLALALLFAILPSRPVASSPAALGLRPTAQEQCGVVSSIAFPVDVAAFTLVQDFAVPSARHQGRYHTGEDYTAGQGRTYGQPVRAIADGRVTYSAPTGWGRDGGVVIIEHVFPDGTLAYSQYGHLFSSDAYPFPERLTCIRGGDIIGVVGDARPAPHLHIEIRTAGSDTPGPGYSWEPPLTAAWLQPSKFILNWQSWLQPAHRWHVLLPEDARPVSPPLALADGSLLVATRDRVRLISSDGRVLWRLVLAQPAVALTWLGERPLLTYADGSMQIVTLEPALAERWATGVPVSGPAVAAGELLLFPTPEGGLVAFAPDRLALAWRADGLGAAQRIQPAGALIGVLTEANALISLSLAGQVLDQAQLSEAAPLVPAPDGSLWVYAQNGFFRLDGSGQWARAVEGLPASGPEGAALIAEDGSWYLLGAEPAALYAFTAQNAPRWQVDLGPLHGVGQISLLGEMLLVQTTGGDLAVVRAADGARCGGLRVYGDRRAAVWSALGADGLLRLAVADQALALDWRTLLGGCA